MPISVGLIYDTSFVNNLSADYEDTPPTSDQLVKLTASIVDTATGEPPTTGGPYTINWSADRSAIVFFDEDGDVVDPPVTDVTDGESTIYVGSPSPALSTVYATLNPPTIRGPAMQPLLFATVESGSTNLGITKIFSDMPVPLKWASENGDWPPFSAHAVINFPNQIQNKPGDSDTVGIWIANIDYNSGVVLGKNAIYADGSLTYASATSDGFEVPYDLMTSDPQGRPINVLQYLVQDPQGGGAVTSQWQTFGARGTAFAQPDPNRPTGSYPQVLVVDSKGVVVTDSVLADDNFVEDPPKSGSKFLWVQVQDLDTFEDTDSIQIFYYINGYNSGTTTPASSIVAGEVTFVSDLKDEEAPKRGVLVLNASALDSISKSSRGTYGTLIITYLVNGMMWSSTQTWPTNFSPITTEETVTGEA